MPRRDKSPRFLAIDTATRYAGLAIYDGSAVLVEESWLSSESHTVELMPKIARAAEQQGLALADLTGLAVSLGPGSFTGLRIGMSVAKGIALATGAPILGIPTLDVLGYAHAQPAVRTCAIIEAGRKRLCVATYQRLPGPDGPAALQRLDDYRTVSPAELVASIEAPTLFCGEMDPELREMLAEQLGPLAALASPARSLRRAGYLAELAWERWQRGERDNLAMLTPLYLQPAAPGACI